MHKTDDKAHYKLDLDYLHTSTTVHEVSQTLQDLWDLLEQNFIRCASQGAVFIFTPRALRS